MPPLHPPRSREQRRVVAATVVGTTIEWYDFFIYANTAALIFGGLFFAPLGSGAGVLVAFATVGISFAFRPLGAVVAGHVGDRLGRRAVLVASLLLMGLSTTLIGLLPTYAQAGVVAPILLVLLRIMQGFSAGGEWGGAALMAVEHAPTGRRGFFGAFPQVGVPAGMLLSTGVLALLSGLLSEEQFLSWGWRLPFLLSIVLLLVGVLIRRNVDESPVFQELQASKSRSDVPLKAVFQTEWRALILCTLVVAACSIAGYLSTGGYLLSYATGTLGINRTTVLSAILVASMFWIITTLIGGGASDRFGRRRVLQAGSLFTLIWSVPLFLAVDSANLILIISALLILTIPLGLMYGPQAATLAEAFPAKLRFSGASIAYAAGAVLGGAFAPMIATWLQTTTGSILAVAGYLAGASAIGLIAATMLADRSNCALIEPASDTSLPTRLASNSSPESFS
ncbi:MFS family permease [Rhodococcus erythropolis]|uniref:MFS transporter n=1 Tax=Rhodococcus erythropolis TaxID=1833 RepID=UPI00216995D5|nr:MFS transporter [Rhodococcus erythropolis]MCS4253049.1 MFS family permease [Rhodococcus erythropolis]MCW2428506.1 MFS family permease [Rhodococcus erythropolis]